MKTKLFFTIIAIILSIGIRAQNTAPVANAGPDQTVNQKATVTLDGSASSDADGDNLIYTWTAPAGITLSDIHAVKPTFTSPVVSANTPYAFQLVVNDGKTNSQPDEVIITVRKTNKIDKEVITTSQSQIYCARINEYSASNPAVIAIQYDYFYSPTMYRNQVVNDTLKKHITSQFSYLIPNINDDTREERFYPNSAFATAKANAGNVNLTNLWDLTHQSALSPGRTTSVFVQKSPNDLIQVTNETEIDNNANNQEFTVLTGTNQYVEFVYIDGLLTTVATKEYYYEHINLQQVTVNRYYNFPGKFITAWKPSNPPSTIGTLPQSTTSQIYFPGIGTNYSIYWEEVGYPTHNGILNRVTSTAGNPVLIDFGTPQNPDAANATYKVMVDNGNGNFSQIRFSDWINSYGDAEKLIDIVQWGNVKWSAMNEAFVDCISLNAISATDVPDFSNATSLANMFGRCTNFTGNASMNSWNTSTITTMSGMFASAQAFNQPVGNWNTSKVERMGGMFYNTKLFNQPIGNWNVAKVVDMMNMFTDAVAFNHDIGGWQTQSLMSINAMFYNAKSFNQDLNSWDVSNVLYMNDAFGNAAAFNQPLDKWNIKNLQYASGIFYNSGISCVNYDKTLIGWGTTQFSTIPSNIDLGDVSPLTYSSNDAMAARNTLMTMKGWKITGDTYDANCNTATEIKNTVTTDKKLSVCPNPATDYFIIQGLEKESEASVIDISGKKVIQKNVSPNEKISVTGWNKGIYFVKTENGTGKLIIR